MNDTDTSSQLFTPAQIKKLTLKSLSTQLPTLNLSYKHIKSKFDYSVMRIHVCMHALYFL